MSDATKFYELRRLDAWITGLCYWKLACSKTVQYRTMTDIILQTKELTKCFGERTAVDHLDLCVERGDIYGFLGPNGAGKSTTLRMLLGLIRPTTGIVQFKSRQSGWEYLKARGRIGSIVEMPAFYENFSGRRNLQLLASLSGGVNPKRVESVLEIVDLKERAHEPVRVYSSGMRQRLGIAQALLPTPELIILDEPTNGLDPQRIKQARQLIHRLHDDLQLTVLISSHLLPEVEQLCNRVGIIHEGRLLYQGKLEELVARVRTYKLRVDQLAAAVHLLAHESSVMIKNNGHQPGSADCRIGETYLHIETAAEQIPAVNALLVGHGIKVYEVSPAREGLEEAFLRLTTGTTRVSHHKQ